MFISLSEKFSEIISSIRGKVIISEDDLNITLREIRVTLLEADVNISVVKKFIEDVKEKILGQNVLKSIKPDQMIIKLVYDELVGTYDFIINTRIYSVLIMLYLRNFIV